MASARPLLWVSVIIPTRERTAPLAECLRALAAQTYPRAGFEILIVDDGSDAADAAAIEALAAEWGARSLRQPPSGPAEARNLGAGQAQGVYLAFTDDDCCPAPGWLAALVAALEAHPGAAAGGPIMNALPHNPYAAASQALVTYIYSYYNRDPQHAVFLTSNNLAFPAEVFNALGGFDCTLHLAAGEDRDLCDRWTLNQHRLIYVPAAVVAHAPAVNARRFWEQHFRYGRGAHGYHRARRARGQPPVPVEPPRFYLNLVRYLAGHAPRGRGWLGALLAVVSQAANFLGYLHQRRLPAAPGLAAPVAELSET